VNGKVQIKTGIKLLSSCASFSKKKKSYVDTILWPKAQGTWNPDGRNFQLRVHNYTEEKEKEEEGKRRWREKERRRKKRMWREDVFSGWIEIKENECKNRRS
jgi:hypothetical protein